MINLIRGCALLCASSILALSACGTKDADEPKKGVVAEAPVTLAAMIDDPRREADKVRDQFRNPLQTLEFFEIAPGQHVVEIWPGWYTKIIAPYLAANDGTYTAVLYTETERNQARLEAFRRSVADEAVYGTVQYGVLDQTSGPMMTPGSADVVLTFRNVHNWMGRGYADKAFTEFYNALKPGGILGVVEHRLPESATQDPTGRSGYVQESYVKALAAEAGFEFVAASEVNANPRDTADHPFGVWTLPPRSRTPEEGSAEAQDFNAELYKNIGESDRMTLKFRKPAMTETMAEPEVITQE